MNYKRYGSDIIVRLDIGEDISEQLLEVAKKEDITLASVTGIGAVNDFTIGIFDLDKKVYDQYRFTGNYEIAALNGNLTTMDGEKYAHLHISAAGAPGNIVGGHLFKAKISLTGEIFIRVYEGGCAERVHDDVMNFNRIQL